MFTMANNTTASLDKWREYFRGANSDIFDIIEYAIMVAASDCPYDFKLKRDRIAEMLFTCKVTKCFGCDRIELALPNDDEEEKIDEKYKNGVEGAGSKDSKESQANNSPDVDDDRRVIMDVKMNQNSNYSYGDAEALTEEIEEEYQFYGEVLRIKEVLDNCEDESDDVLFDSLRRLQLMPLSVETLKATEIGKSVNALRKHGSKDIRSLVRTLIEDWKVMVDAWVAATAAIEGAEVETESIKTSATEEEEGLPSPPLDEGAFFATPTSMELSQFFDGMDDDGNPQNSGEFNKNRDNGRKPNPNRTGLPKMKAESPNAYTPPLPPPHHPPKDRKPEPKRNQEATLNKQTPPVKPNRPSGSESWHGRPKPTGGESGPGRPRQPMLPKVVNEVKSQQKPVKGPIQKKQAPPRQEKLNSNNEASVRMKLEAAKRKLHERYQEAENAKKQRTVQMVELHDLPKQSMEQRNQHHTRPGNPNRQWANGRCCNYQT